MKSILMLVSVVFYGMASAQPATAQKSPRDVVGEYWKMETHGIRLTPEGLSKTNHFFIRPSRPALNKIHVIANHDDGRIDETARTDNWAEVYVGTLEVGQLDSAVRLTRSPERASNGALIMGPLIKFDLALTDKHWDLKPDGATGAELTGPPEWRIVGTDNGVWINVDTAIRYVTDMRDKTHDPLTKKNAERTLAELKKSQ